MTRGVPPCTVTADNVIHLNLDEIEFKEDDNYIIDPTNPNGRSIYKWYNWLAQVYSSYT